MAKKRIQETESTLRQLNRPPFDAKQGRDEMNLVEFPLTLLTEKTIPGQSSLHWKDDVLENGRMIHREVIVAGSPEWGLPTAKDEDVLIGLLQLTKAKQDFTDATVYFTRLELIDLLEWPNHHWSYSRLAKSFERWRAVSISYKQAWRDNRNRQWLNRTGFGLIDSFELTDARRAGTAEIIGEGRSWYRWNGYLFDSFRAGFLKKLDYDVYKGLDSQIAKRLYRYLDKQFYGPARQRLDFDLRILACEHLGLSRNYDTAQIRRKLQPAIEELEAIGFLGILDAADRFRKIGWGKWKVTFGRKSSEAKLESPKEPVEPSRRTDKPEDDVLWRFHQLPPDEQQRFERDAVSSASVFLRTSYQDSQGPFRDATRRKLLADHFTRLGR
jgi:hypothetical protein